MCSTLLQQHLGLALLQGLAQGQQLAAGVRSLGLRMLRLLLMTGA
jgi:hypothetical protein